ncbi:uncharacterized protein F5891DRAFT_986290 [Suillus fuscotomentosus]|uniref:Uncharacterized protein n=1 Tax=Suillus fuscotomentosus TaxID=1912939 RepID=A0AAD4DSF7_9AGAM|nr:uncharacterized protein F5891DRAFT_986290 [Suillus fuscotomentosus]KAG1892966.1 hypothetical protein F5891DRAFT_986290 [Suillus fuscotomentosus]
MISGEIVDAGDILNTLVVHIGKLDRVAGQNKICQPGRCLWFDRIILSKIWRNYRIVLVVQGENVARSDTIAVLRSCHHDILQAAGAFLQHRSLSKIRDDSFRSDAGQLQGCGAALKKGVPLRGYWKAAKGSRQKGTSCSPVGPLSGLVPPRVYCGLYCSRAKQQVIASAIILANLIAFSLSLGGAVIVEDGEDSGSIECMDFRQKLYSLWELGVMMTHWAFPPDIASPIFISKRKW